MKFLSYFYRSQAVNAAFFQLPSKIILLGFCLLFATYVQSDQPETPEKNVTEYKILVLGDSLSAAYGLTTNEGWVSLLNQKWQQENVPATLINAAISGDTTDGGLARLPRLLSLHKPTHLYIELGGNNGLQGHKPSKIKQNLVNMIEIAGKNDVRVILQEMQIPTNYGSKYTKIFNRIYHDLAEQFELTLIPFFLQEIALSPNLMQNDGIHPTAEAQPKIVEFMSPKLLEALLHTPQ